MFENFIEAEIDIILVLQINQDIFICSLRYNIIQFAILYYYNIFRRYVID